jgi:hypothetical protein
METLFRFLCADLHRYSALHRLAQEANLRSKKLLGALYRTNYGQN